MADFKHLKDLNKVNNVSHYEEVAKILVDELGAYEDGFAELADVPARETDTERSCFTEKAPSSETTTEKRWCRCFYFTNVKNGTPHCEKCDLRNREGYRSKITGNFQVADYEFVVAATTGYGVGNIDLILADENFAYFTEVKPQGSSETLLRMFLEIETYYRMAMKNERYKNVIGDKPVRKAILFFKDSEQEKVFLDSNQAEYTKKLLKLFGITVFCAEPKNGEVYITAIA